MSADGVTRLDLTPPAAQPRDFAPLRDTLVLFGVPVYAGRLPAVAAQRLRRLQGTGTPAVLVVVYGNRLFEDALLELQHLVVERGFRPWLAAGFWANILIPQWNCPCRRVVPTRRICSGRRISAGRFGKKCGESRMWRIFRPYPCRGTSPTAKGTSRRTLPP
jgi:hypothetical protein